MKNRKTIYLVFSIFGVMLFALMLSYIPYVAIYREGHYVTYLPYFINAAADLFISLAFCLVIWFMFMRNPGNKIPPIVMLVIGLLGLALVPLNIYAGYYNTAPWLGSIYDPPVTIMCTLFTVFGIAGLFTRSKDK